jgi:hypothetical protein
MAENSQHVLITGTGSLASKVLYELIRSTDASLHVTIASRESSRLRWIVRSAHVLVPEARARVGLATLDWNDENSLQSVLRRVRPQLVLHTASLQSPWSLSGSDTWSKLVSTGGYGYTLPFHLILALRLAREIDRVVPGTMFINACYPDAVNPMLRAAGTPITCGVGNVGILNALLCADLQIRNGEVKMIAHHSHLGAASPNAGTKRLSTLKAWRNNQHWDDAARDWLRGAALPPDETLNTLTAKTISTVIHSLVGTQPSTHAHVPGPDGLPGGYPVVLEAGKVSLSLPPGLTKREAISCNISAAEFDGVMVDSDGKAVFSHEYNPVVRDLIGHDTGAFAPLPVDGIEARINKLLAVRERLLQTPATPTQCNLANEGATV